MSFSMYFLRLILHSCPSCQHAFMLRHHGLYHSETTNQLKPFFYKSPCSRCFVTATEKKLTHYPSPLASSSSRSSLLSPKRTPPPTHTLVPAAPPRNTWCPTHLRPKKACLQCPPRAPGPQGLALVLRCLPTTKLHSACADSVGLGRQGSAC